MTDMTSPTFRQVRNVSGFARPMSVRDAFMYNFLAMGVIFPWTFLWGPASFPGGSVEIAIWIALLAQLPISLAYCFMATVLPVSGGDYIYQTRAFGKVGFIVVMSGFVIWILQWVALSGWLMATLGFAPWLLVVGVGFGSPGLVAASQWVQGPAGVTAISLGLALFTTLFLTRGLRLYVVVQRFLFAATIAAIITVLYVFYSHAAGFTRELDAFVAAAASHLPGSVVGVDTAGFVGTVVQEVSNSGFPLKQPFAWLPTLGIVPIAWTSLQWATYSVEQNTEIAEADRFSRQFGILLLSAVAVSCCLWLVAHFQHLATGEELVAAFSAAYWNLAASPENVAFLKGTLQPFPSTLAMAVAGSVILTTVIALGFVANAFQVTCNCFIGVTRILVAMGSDGFMRSLRLDTVDPIRHAPVRAHWVYLLASIPWILAYNFFPGWAGYTLGVTFACGYVFTLSALAAARIPSPGLRSLWLASTIYRVPPVIIRVVGILGFGCGGIMVAAYLVFPQYGLAATTPYLIVAGTVLISYAIYVASRARSPLIDAAMRQAPEEVQQFYRDSSGPTPPHP